MKSAEGLSVARHVQISGCGMCTAGFVECRRGAQRQREGVVRLIKKCYARRTVKVVYAPAADRCGPE